MSRRGGPAAPARRRPAARPITPARLTGGEQPRRPDGGPLRRPPHARTAGSRQRFALRAGGAGGLGLVALLAAIVVSSGTSQHSNAAAAAGAAASPVPEPTPTTAAGRWRADAVKAFAPMQGVLIPMLQAFEGWRTRKAPGAKLVSVVGVELRNVEQTRGDLARLRPFPAAPRALGDYQASVALYSAAFRAARAAALLPESPITAQLRRAVSRDLRLADRTFDLAGAELEPYDPVQREVADVVVRRPDPVPDWRALGLTAGAPLAPAGGAAPPVGYGPRAPASPLPAWVSAVRRISPPSSAAVAAQLRSDGPDALRGLATILQRSSDDVGRLPPPARASTIATTLRLGLLAQAEAVQLAVAARLAGSAGRALGDEASALAEAGRALRQAALPDAGASPAP